MQIVVENVCSVWIWGNLGWKITLFENAWNVSYSSLHLCMIKDFLKQQANVDIWQIVLFII